MTRREFYDIADCEYADLCTRRKEGRIFDLKVDRRILNFEHLKSRGFHQYSLYFFSSFYYCLNAYLM